ncbi:MAG: hypothetical protein HYY32_03255 [Chloroflexi bacterium]|nr:hypothetical protein [Chloroflexota bacterium]
MPLSVREAKWVGRLYKSVQAGNIGLLAKFAETLSSIEICHKVIPSPDTRDWRQLQLWWYEVITRGQETVTEDRKQKALATMSQPGYWTTTFVDVFREMVQQEKAKDPQSARQGQLDGTIPLPPRGRQVPKGRRA